MEQKHTSGPWSINGNKIDGNGYHIVSVNSHRTSEGEANARLISAAPELLEALEKFIEYEKLMDDENLANAMFAYVEFADMARSSIAKATGE